jgi:iron complex outermembrane receptor protein
MIVGLLAGATHMPLHAQETLPPPPEEETPAAAPAQPATAQADDEYDEEIDGEEIVVTGSRPRGSVIGDIPPEQTLTGRDIRAYGAGSLTELLDALAPQTQSGRGRGGGRPITLLNGRRISGFSEIRDIPPEAIARVEILPEEVALKYGYRADQRVVNIVLRRRFRAITGEIEGGLATAGGRGTYEADVNMLRIDDAGRWNVNAEYKHSSPLFESERDLIQQSSSSRPFDLLGNIGGATPGGEIDPALSALAGQPVTVAGVPASASGGAPSLSAFVPGANNANMTDLGRYRTLLGESDQLSLNGTLNRTVFGDVSATLNATFDATRNKSHLGLPSAALLLPAGNPYSPFASDVTLYRYFDAPGALVRRSDTRAGHLGVSLNGDMLPWRWSFTGNYDLSSSHSRTDTGIDPESAQARLDANDASFNPFAPFSGDLLTPNPRDRARSTTQVANAELVTNGTIVGLPAGNVASTIKVGVETRGIRSETLRSGIEQDRELSRGRGNIQANIDIPVASRSRDVLATIGNLSLNANAEVEELSDFGTLTTLGGGINWSPIEEVRVIASVTDEDGAPSIQQLGDPVVATPNVRVFDFVRGETVDITRIDGGNNSLLADSRRVMKIGLNVRPWSEKDISFRADYVRTRIRDMIASFPTATPEIEAAFPDRFQRDAEGRLLQIDSRPVNFARADTEQLRWGINFSKPIGPQGRPGGPGAGGGRGNWARRGETGGPAPEAPAQPAPATDAASAAQAAPGTSPAAPNPQEQAAPPAPQGAPGQGQFRGGGGGRGFGGGGRGFGGGGQGGRLQLSLFHSWQLQDRVLIREGVPELDFLNGSAVGNSGGRPRHQIDAEAGIFKNGMGARLTTTWRSGTTVRGDAGGAAGSNGDLFFSDFATVNLRLFADLGQQRSLVTKYPWLRGTRVTFAVDNLLDSRPQVRDEAGATPFSYQPNYMDPLGRFVRVSVRKLFF